MTLKELNQKYLEAKFATDKQVFLEYATTMVNQFPHVLKVALQAEKLMETAEEKQLCVDDYSALNESLEKFK